MKHMEIMLAKIMPPPRMFQIANIASKNAGIIWNMQELFEIVEQPSKS